MLKLKHRREATDQPLTAADEARIRADERRRVLAERDAPADDWRTTPPPPTEPRVADPSATAPTQSTSALAGDPRGWDVRDDETEMMGDRQMMREERTERWTDADVRQEDTVVERGFSPGQVLILLAGAASLVLGIIAVVRTGLDDSLSDPAETVLWWEHTALLGLFEIGAGALMILSALHPALRWLGGLVGLAAIVGGVLILSELDWTMNELGAERDFGWVPIGIGAVAVIGAAIPRVRRTRRVSETTARPMTH